MACSRYAGPPRGAGDIVDKATTLLRIKQLLGDCSGCEQRRAALNRLLPMPDTHTED